MAAAAKRQNKTVAMNCGEFMPHLSKMSEIAHTVQGGKTCNGLGEKNDSGRLLLAPSCRAGQ